MKKEYLIQAKEKYNNLKEENDLQTKRLKKIYELRDTDPLLTGWMNELLELKKNNSKLAYTEQELVFESFNNIEDDIDTPYICIEYYNMVPQDDWFLGETKIGTGKYDKILSTKLNAEMALYYSLDSGKKIIIKSSEEINLFEQEHNIFLRPEAYKDITNYKELRFNYLNEKLNEELIINKH